jgi:hypothetical protein
MPLDWLLAEKTSWWGKPLDPKRFWKGRVVWLDSRAREAARARGRGLPPIPFEDPAIPEYAEEKGHEQLEGTIEGPNIHFRWDSKERAFWTKFAAEHPRPPEDILDKQEALAEAILGRRFSYDHLGNPARTSLNRIAERDRTGIQSAIASGFPGEALSEKALFWTYVAAQRAAYLDLVARGIGPTSPATSNFLARLLVSADYVTTASADEGAKEATAWHVAYLRRLKAEGSDESYILAYLQAWDLSANAVFGESK